MALPFPPFLAACTMVSTPGTGGTPASTCAVPSLEPSFTTTISRATGSGIVNRRSITCRTVRASL